VKRRTGSIFRSPGGTSLALASPRGQDAVFGGNPGISGRFGDFPACIGVPARGNFDRRNAQMEVRRRTFPQPEQEKPGGFSTMAKAAAKPPTKTEVFSTIAETTGLTKRDVSNVFDALADQIKKAVGSRGPKTFTIHGIAKIVVQHKPATKERQGINPFTGEPTTFKAKPARNVVKIRPLKKLKDMVS
jgi:nucleoid DNA-binding protein